MSTPPRSHPHPGLRVWIGLSLPILYAIDVALPVGGAMALGYLIPVVFSSRLGNPRATQLITALSVILCVLGAVLSPPQGPAWVLVASLGLQTLSLLFVGDVATGWVRREQDQRAQLQECAASTRKEALRSEQQFNSIESIMIELDQDGVICRWNPAAEATFGLESGAIIGQRLVDGPLEWHPEDAAVLRAKLHEREQVKAIELRYNDEKGSERWLGLSISHFQVESLGFGGSLLLARDITAARNKGQVSKRLITAVEQVNETIVITDLKGKILYVNPAFSRATGYTRREALGLEPRLLSSGKQPREFYEKMWTTILAGNVWTGHFTNRRKDGTLFEEEATISPVRDEAGDVTNFVAVKKDITERLAMESQLRTAQKLESIGQLAAGIAHEINTPSQFISDNMRFLEGAFESLIPLLKLCESLSADTEAEQRDKVFQDLDQITSEINLDFLIEEIPDAFTESLAGLAKVTEIVSAMKSFSHPGVKEKLALNLNEIIETTIVLSTNEWKYVSEVKTDLDPELPQITGLPGELGQVFLNMIVNAAHAIEAAGVGGLGTISIKSTHDEGADEVRVSISDTGCGIPTESLERVFDQFFTTKEVGKGTGQGLALCHCVVSDKHGGRISLESTVGVGTTFTIHLPIEGSKPQSESQKTAA